jgi:hypothetical protein
MALDVEIIDGCVVRIREAKSASAKTVTDQWTIGENCTVNVKADEK